MSDTLVLVHIAFRHGDRTPLAVVDFPKNPHREETYHPFGKGQLTLKGKQRSYEFGQSLRKTYEKFLGIQYFPDLISAHSSYFNRAVMTMQLVLAGLFPPNKNEFIKDGLNWQPIEFQVLEKGNKLLNFEMRKALTIMDFSKQNMEKKELFEKLTKLTGLNVTHFGIVMFIHDIFQVQKECGLKNPDWAEEILPILKKEAMQIFKDMTDYYIGDIIGDLLNKILEDTKRKISGEIPNTKMFLYSCHDVNIVPLLVFLGNYHQQCVHYNSYISFELHKIHGEYGFKFLHYNYDTREPQYLVIPNIGQFCPLNVFEKMVTETVCKRKL